MTLKSRRIILAFLSSSFMFLFFLASVSAQGNVQEFLDNNISQITVTMTPTESWADLSIDTSSSTFDSQSVDIQNEIINDVNVDKIAFSFDISGILGDLNGVVDLPNNSNTPQFSSLDVTSNSLIHSINISIGGFSLTGDMSTKNFFQNVLNNLNLNVNLSSKDSVNSYLEQNPLSTTSDRHVTFTKQGTNYKILNNIGLGDIPSEWESKIESEVKDSVNSASVPQILNTIAPFLGDSFDTSFLEGFGLNYSVKSVDLSNVQLKDGTYLVPVSVSDGSSVYVKNISLVLKGIKTQNAIDETTVVNEGVTNVIFDSGSSNVKRVIIPNSISQNKEITLDMSSLLSGSAVTLLNSLSLERQSTNNYSADISPGTSISGAGWDGKLILPTLKTSSDYGVSGGIVDVVVDFGSVNEITFTKPVKITLGGMAGKKAGWTRGTTITNIVTVCNSASNPTNIDSLNFRECYTNSADGKNLIIWTYHFTSFAAFTPTSSSTKTLGHSTSYSSSHLNETTDTVSNQTNPTQNLGESTPPSQPGFFGTITGAVIGTLGTGGLVIVILFIVFIVGLFTLLNIKTKKKKKKSKEEEGDAHEE